jgi:MGT family glycosyltransferase
VVPIAEELVARGHSVSVRTLRAEVPTVRRLGLRASPIARAIEAIELRDYTQRTLLGKGRSALATFLARADYDRHDLCRAAAEESAEAVLVDCMCWGATVTAEASGLPWAQYVPLPLIAPSRGRPPVGLGLRPAHGPAGRARDSMLRSLAALGSDWGNLTRLNEIRVAAGTRKLEHLTDVFTLAPVVLHLMAEALDPWSVDWPDRVRTVGPCVWEPPMAPPLWLTSLDRPLILVSASSEWQADSRIVDAAVSAFGDSKFALAATLPAATTTPVELPANVKVERFLAHRPLLEKAVLAITHGGAGVTQKALAAGVPVCVVPFGRDQYEIARRIETLGIGTRLPARSLTPQRLRAAATEAIGMRSAAVALSERIGARTAPIRAADELEKLLESHVQGRWR